MQMRRTNDDNGDGEMDNDEHDDDNNGGWLELSQYHEQVVALIGQLTPHCTTMATVSGCRQI